MVVRNYIRFANLDSLHGVEDGLGELVGGGSTAHIGSADLARRESAIEHTHEQMKKKKLTPQQ